jgi:hydrogenase maturation protease
MFRVSVIGIGNVLAGDDAVGPTVARVLDARYELPPGVEAIDAGTPGHELAALLAGLDAAVLVDAVRAKGPAGTVRTLDPESLLERRAPVPLSPHEPNVREALLAAKLAGAMPRFVRLVGIVPEHTGVGIGLSDPVRASIPAAVDAVAQELEAIGVPLHPRTPPRDPDLWWER